MLPYIVKRLLVAVPTLLAVLTVVFFFVRIAPGDPECSTVRYRAGVRDDYPGPYFNQMPPLLSHRVSVEAVETLRRWIGSLPITE